MNKAVLFSIGLFVFASFSYAENTGKANPFSGQAEILTSVQVAAYMKLRRYASAKSSHERSEHKH